MIAAFNNKHYNVCVNKYHLRKISYIHIYKYYRIEKLEYRYKRINEWMDESKGGSVAWS